MKRRITTVAVAVAIAMLSADDRTSRVNWAAYLGGADSHQYSALAQISKSNVAQLEVAWTYTVGSGTLRFNPVVVDGVMYVLGANRSIVALDAATGMERWVHRNEGAVGDRGMAYWESKDRSERRLLYMNGGYLTAIDAKTGFPISSFGDDGKVDVRVGLHRDVTSLRPLQTGNPGRIFEDLIIMSLPAGGIAYASNPGDVHAYNVRTGELQWVFHSVPEKDEFGADTWPEAALASGGGVHDWSELSVDEARGIAYIPFGTARFDFYGGNRRGNNLFANSLVALDARTGKRLWHYQLIHHDLWDYDLPQAPKLLTVRHDGRNVDVVAQATKQGFVFVFDRTNGRPLWPIEERPVPQTDVPGEWTSPTQPFPTMPPPFARQSFTEKDINPHVSPEDQAKLRELFKTVRNDGLFTPPSLQGSIEMPGHNGGANWGSTAVDPVKGTMYIVNKNLPTLMKLFPPRGQDGASPGFVPYDSPVNFMLQTNGLSAISPPWSALTAFDLNAGKMLWQIPDGDFPGLAPGSHAPRGGPVVTAGGLLFVGTSSDRTMRAYDQDTGKVLWERRLPAAAEGVPAVYEVGGREFVAISVGGSGLFAPRGAGDLTPPGPSQYIVFALPERGTAQRPAATPAQEWRTYDHDLAGTRFSPLTEINAGNVAKLAKAWTYTFPPPPAGRGGGGLLSGSEAVPLVASGVMYLPAGNTIVALEADTGTMIWQREIGGGAQAGGVSRRGVGFWPGDGTMPPRVLVTAGRRLLSLDASSGKPSEGFGANGEVDMVVGYGGTPTIYKNAVLVGAAVNEVPLGPPGDTRAFDAITGRKLWEFHTVPRPGETGHETWLDNGWDHRSGTNVWAFSMTVDEARGIVYMPVAGPAANYWGGDRPGNNLFANSIVAVDIATGAYRWHFQTVHHDIWDIDMSAAPGLVDVRQGSRTVPALATVGKGGYLFILDRTNGKPVFGVEERPVPKGNVPGEWYSPTQPFPLKPPALAKTNFKKEDMVTAADTTAEHAAACQALWDRSGGFLNRGPFTPFTFHEDGAPPKSTISFPGGTGGINWGGTAVDPRSSYIYVNSHDTSLVGWVEKKKPGVTYSFDAVGSTQPYDRASVDSVGPFHSFSASMGKDAAGRDIVLPCQRPPWSRLVAVNANTGEIAWQTTLGINESLPAGKQNVGGSGSAGPTVTAGGLVFVGATDDRRFRAFDSKTGKELWVARLDGVGNANPISYQARNGKQYVAIVATSQVVVFALP